jgi:hypothetical protein
VTGALTVMHTRRYGARDTSRGTSALVKVVGLGVKLAISAEAHDVIVVGSVSQQTKDMEWLGKSALLFLYRNLRLES